MNSGEQRSTSRNQGYRNAEGKEAKAKAVFKSFLEHYQFEITEITDLTTQINLGDYRNGKDRYIECKSQGIGGYAKNFIEVGEYLPSVNDKHRGGHALTSEWLSRYGIDLYDCNIRERFYTNPTQKFGNPEFYNPGITPLIRGADVFYINRDTELIYFYRSEKLQQLIVDEIRADRLFWGGGKANSSTIAVFVENSPIAWQKVKGEWKFMGAPELEEQVWSYLKGL